MQSSMPAGLHHHDQQVQPKKTPSLNRKKEADQPGTPISGKKKWAKKGNNREQNELKNINLYTGLQDFTCRNVQSMANCIQNQF